MPAGQPNILLIMSDQHRGDCLGIDDHPVLLTPHMDSIGGQGTHFARAYTTCPSCIPARRSLMTGQYPATHGMVGMIGGCPITVPTLPERLQEAGYRTAIVGRDMHQSPADAAYGFEYRNYCGTGGGEFDGYTREMAEAGLGSSYLRRREVGLTNNGWTARPWHMEERWHPTTWSASKAREVMLGHGKSDDRPLFLAASFAAPHPPLCPPAWYLDRYLRLALPEPSIGEWAVPPPNEGRGLRVESPRVCLKGEALRACLAGYYGLINHLDGQLSWILRDWFGLCREQGRPWVIVYTTDHGEMLGDHYYFRKCEPYEGSARIPLLVQGSSELGFVNGQRIESPACLEDLMPTLLELAGGTLPEGVDGRSLLPVLRGESGSVRDVLHFEHSYLYSRPQGFHALTDGQLKYIWRPHDGTEQLFDLSADPGECRNLATRRAYADLLVRWRARMIAQLKDRPEGFTDGERLMPGREYGQLLPHAKQPS